MEGNLSSQMEERALSSWMLCVRRTVFAAQPIGYGNSSLYVWDSRYRVGGGEVGSVPVPLVVYRSPGLRAHVSWAPNIV